MKTFTVTVERTMVHTDKYEVQADNEDEAIEMVQDGDLDAFCEDCEEVDVQYDALEL